MSLYRIVEDALSNAGRLKDGLVDAADATRRIVAGLHAEAMSEDEVGLEVLEQYSYEMGEAAGRRENDADLVNLRVENERLRTAINLAIQQCDGIIVGAEQELAKRCLPNDESHWEGRSYAAAQIRDHIVDCLGATDSVSSIEPKEGG